MTVLNKLESRPLLLCGLLCVACVDEQILAETGTDGVGQTGGGQQTDATAPNPGEVSSGNTTGAGIGASTETGDSPDITECPGATQEKGCAFVWAAVDPSAPADSRRVHASINGIDGEGSDGVVEMTFEWVPYGLPEPELLDILTVGTVGKLQWTAPDDLLLPATNGSVLRSGGLLRLTSTAAIRAEQELEFGGQRWAMTPTATLPAQYVVERQTRTITILAVSDNTTVQWQPSVATAGTGLPVDPVAPGEVGTLVLNRHEVFQLGVSDVESTDGSLEGTVITADSGIVCLACTAVPG